MVDTDVQTHRDSIKAFPDGQPINEAAACCVCVYTHTAGPVTRKPGSRDPVTMVNIRQATVCGTRGLARLVRSCLTRLCSQMHDMIAIQACNLACLPENYNLRYFLYHLIAWPQVRMCATGAGAAVPCGRRNLICAAGIRG